MDPLSWLEISRGALQHNVATIRERLRPGTSLLAVVKANAYGHGMHVVAQSIADHVDWLGVDSLDEALGLHNAGIRLRILIMGFTPHSRADEVVRHGFRQVIFDEESAVRLSEQAAAQGTTAAVHVKIGDRHVSPRCCLPEGSRLPA